MSESGTILFLRYMIYLWSDLEDTEYVVW